MVKDLETRDHNKKIFISYMSLLKNCSLQLESVIFVEPQGSRPFTLEFSMFLDSRHVTTTGLAQTLLLLLHVF